MTETQNNEAITTFSIPGQPVGKARPRFTRSGHTYTPDKTKSYENLVALEYRAAGGRMTDGRVYFRITAGYGIPKSTPKAKKEKMLAGTIMPTVKPDIDNVIKIILDGLNGVAYKDDSQVCFIKASKEYTEEPKVEVSVVYYDAE